MSLTINGTTINPFVTAFAGNVTSPAAGNYYPDSRDPFGSPPTQGALQYDDRMIRFPGVYAIGIKRMTLTGRPIHADIIVSHTSKANTAGAANSLLSSFNQLARYTITLPDGVSHPGCRLTNASEVHWFSVGTSICVVLSCEFVQLQES